MKRKRIWIVIITIIFLLSLAVIFTACDRPREEPTPFTQEELFAKWVVGRDFSMNYDGVFTTRYTSVNNDSQNKSKGENTESWGGNNKYFYVQNTYAMDENAQYQLVEELVEVLRLVDENGTQKTKMFYKQAENGAVLEKWDNEAEPDCRNANFRICPKSIIADEENFITKGDTYETFIAAVKAAALDPENGYGIEPASITFVQNEDGSVTFELLFAANRELEEEGCVMDVTDKLSVTVKDGKVVEYASKATMEYKFEDETKNMAADMSQSYKFSYVFDTVMHKAFDIDNDQTDLLEGLNTAKNYVKQLYINNNEETAADYTVISKVNIGGVMYPVSWAITINTEGASVDDVKVVAGESNVTIDVIDMAENDIEYTLTATVMDANGNTATVDFKRKVPKFHVATWAEYAEAEDGKLLVVEGIVTMFNSKKDGKSFNSMYIQDNDGAYYAYSMNEDPKDKNIAVGMKVRLAGTKKNYNGTYELEKVLIKEIINMSIAEVVPINIEEIFANATSVKDKVLTNLQGCMVTVKGAIAAEVDTENKYCYFTVGGIKAYIRPSASAGFLNNTEISKFIEDFTKNKGHLVDVTGQAVVYSGAFYMQPVKTDAVVYGEVADLEPAEQVKFVKENANALKDVTYSGYTVTLPSASDVFTDVKIAWTVDNTDVCKIENGVAKFTYDYATAGRTVKLTATYTHATDTTVAPLTNEYTLELLIPQDATVEEFLAKDKDVRGFNTKKYLTIQVAKS